MSGNASADGFFLAADFNQDGRIDLFATHGIALNRGDGLLGNLNQLQIDAVVRQSAAADLNGDGFPDIATPLLGSASLQILTNHSGLLSASSLVALGHPTPGALSAADVNGDGIPDLAIAHRQPAGPLNVLTNDGQGTFTILTSITNALFGPVWVRLVDVNSDQSADMICGDRAGSVSIFTNAMGTNFALSSVVTNMLGTTTARQRSIGDIADVNGDGRPDLLCPSFLTNAAPFLNVLKVATNAGNGIFVPASTAALGPLATNEARGAVLIAAEFNLDGRVDCVFQSEPDDRFVVATNRGDGVFAVARTMVTAPERSGLTVGDFNADGKADIVSGDRHGLIQIYINTTPTSAPSGRIARDASGSNVIYWQGAPGQFDLQFATEAESSNWHTVVDGTPITGIIVSNSAPQLFFRLQER
ncbi:MAG TPA: VCBS repeat-containing protein [Verrucomicrobiae bacterium]|nr:VCBS repeat-containing protein [Verrucomicrobiae bacterium]